MRPYASLRGRRAFALAMRRGMAATTTSFTLFGYDPGAARASSKIGLVVPRAVGGAVVRNRLRRRCRAIFEKADFGDRARWYVLQCRAEAANLPFGELKEQLLAAFARARDHARARSVRKAT